MDPPYQSGIEDSIFAVLSNQNYITDDTLIIVEADLSKSFAFLEKYNFTVIKEKLYKTNKHVFIKKS